MGMIWQQYYDGCGDKAYYLVSLDGTMAPAI